MCALIPTLRCRSSRFTSASVTAGVVPALGASVARHRAETPQPRAATREPARAAKDSCAGRTLAAHGTSIACMLVVPCQKKLLGKSLQIARKMSGEKLARVGSKQKKSYATRTGFEPVRAEPNRLPPKSVSKFVRGDPVNHSGTLSYFSSRSASTLLNHVGSPHHALRMDPPRLPHPRDAQLRLVKVQCSVVPHAKCVAVVGGRGDGASVVRGPPRRQGTDLTGP